MAGPTSLIRSMRPAMRSVSPAPSAISMGSARASGSSSSPRDARTTPRAPQASIASPQFRRRETARDRRGSPGFRARESRRRRHLLVQLCQTILCEREQPCAVLLGGTTVLVAGAPQERGIDRVQFQSASTDPARHPYRARGRLQVGGQAPFQEESERTDGGFLELGH